MTRKDPPAPAQDDVVAAAFAEVSRPHVADPNAPAPTLHDIFRHACPRECEEHYTPPGYSIYPETPGAYCLHKLNGEQGAIGIMHNPIVLTAWCSNETDGTKSLEIAWQAMRKWHRRVVKKEILADSRKIISELARHGCPVTSGNARAVVAYLAAYERTNIGALPCRKISQQMGWQEDGSFLVGRKCIGGATEFVADDDGEKAMASSFAQAGSFDGWRDAARIVARYPRAALGIYASLSPVLLEPLGLASYAIDWSYRTSSGKTTTLRIAAS